jgi:hypothetical protein
MFKLARTVWVRMFGDWVSTYAKVLEEVLGLGVDVELTVVGVLGEVQSRDLGNVLILALSLLLLELEGDTTDGTTLDTLHQVGGVAGCGGSDC